jgi:hypothetical protein
MILQAFAGTVRFDVLRWWAIAAVAGYLPRTLGFKDRDMAAFHRRE